MAYFFFFLLETFRLRVGERSFAEAQCLSAGAAESAPWHLLFPSVLFWALHCDSARTRCVWLIHTGCYFQFQPLLLLRWNDSVEKFLEIPRPQPPLPPPGAAAALHCRLDGPLHVAERQGPRQLLHPVPDGAGGPAGHRPAGPQLPLPVGHRGPGQRRGRLRAGLKTPVGGVSGMDGGNFVLPDATINHAPHFHGLVALWSRIFTCLLRHLAGVRTIFCTSSWIQSAQRTLYSAFCLFLTVGVVCTRALV